MEALSVFVEEIGDAFSVSETKRANDTVFESEVHPVMQSRLAVIIVPEDSEDGLRRKARHMLAMWNEASE